MATVDPDDTKDNYCTIILMFIVAHWKGVYIVVWPLLSTVVFFLGFEAKFRCMFVVLLMSGYWVTQCIPLYVTGLMPVFLLPILNVENTENICISYMNTANAMFMANLLMALGIEYSQLHKRIAYLTIRKIGCSPRRLHFGLTFVTCFMSMWFENSATTALMCPVIMAVLQELELEGLGNVFQPKGPDDDEDDVPQPTNITIAYFLSAAYAATIGGTGTIIGTTTNLAYKGLYETWFPDDELQFITWMLFNIPPMLITSLFSWLILEVLFMGLGRPNSKEALLLNEGAARQETAYNVLSQKVVDLGRMKWNEGGVLALFIICITLWLTRNPQICPGWGSFYQTNIADATTAVFVVIMFVALPSTLSVFQFCTLKHSLRPRRPTISLVPFRVLQKKMPWGLIFFLGGGYALADAGKSSGMGQYLGQKLTVMSNLPTSVVLLLVALFASFLTEIMSNTALCNIIIPVIIEMSLAMEVHPILLTYPTCMACSLAFMLPVATPSNAIAAGAANIPTTAMMKAGICIKLFGWLLWCVLFPTYGSLFYNQKGFPAWATGNHTRQAVFPIDI